MGRRVGEEVDQPSRWQSHVMRVLHRKIDTARGRLCCGCVSVAYCNSYCGLFDVPAVASVYQVTRCKKLILSCIQSCIYSTSRDAPRPDLWVEDWKESLSSVRMRSRMDWRRYIACAGDEIDTCTISSLATLAFAGRTHGCGVEVREDS